MSKSFSSTDTKIIIILVVKILNEGKMTRKILVAALLSSFVFTACNNIGGKDNLVARIGNENVYEGDVDLIANNEKGGHRSESFRTSVSDYFSKVALVAQYLSEHPDVEQKWLDYEPYLRTRLLTMVYQRFYAMENLEYSDAELKDFFVKNKPLLKEDSNASFLDVRAKVAELLYLSQNADSLNSFMEQTVLGQRVPGKVSFVYVNSTDSAAVALAKKAFEDGVEVDSIPNIKRGGAQEDIVAGPFSEEKLQKALFGEDSIKTGESIYTVIDSLYAAVKVVDRKLAKMPSLEERRPELERQFVQNHRQVIMNTRGEELMKKHGVQIEPIQPPDPEEYYYKHKEKYMTIPSYEVYHVESVDSSFLATQFVEKDSMSLDKFTEIAEKFSGNKVTKAQKGLVGRVKQNYTLPYGIGSMPALFQEIEGKKEGYVSTVLRGEAPILPKYHVFYLSKVVPSAVKPYDRARAEVESQIKSGSVFDLDSNFALVTKGGKPAFIEADLLPILVMEGVPEKELKNLNRTRMAERFASFIAFSSEALEKKLDHTWEYRAIVRQSRNNFIIKTLVDDYEKTYRFPEDSLKKVYDEIGGSPMDGSLEFAEAKRHIDDYLFYPKNLLEKDYYFFDMDKKGTMEQSRVELFKKRARDLARVENSVRMAKAWATLKTFFYNDFYQSLVFRNSAEEHVAKADSLANAKEFSAASSQWNLVRLMFPENDTLFAKATYEIARLENDRENYRDAQAEYYAFYKQWPNAPEAEKALFSRGFILNENLHQDSLAAEVFEEFEKRYPNSELFESVDWLLKNIRSNGKLAEDLMETINKAEEAEPATQDAQK